MDDKLEISYDTPFATTIYYSKGDFDLSGYVDTAYKIRKKTGEIGENAGWQTQVDYLLETTEFQPIIDRISKIMSFLYTQYGIKKSPVLKNYWLNIKKQGDYNPHYDAPHSHAECYFSAVLYLKTPEKCGDLMFMRPDPFTDMFDDVISTPNNHGLWRVTPKENNIVIFPSYLTHYVEPSRTEEDRISMAFNFK